MIERHGLPAWPWPENRIVVLHRGLHLRKGLSTLYRVEAINLGQRKALLCPFFDLFNLQMLQAEAIRAEVATFETIATYRPTLNPKSRHVDDRTWHDAILDDDPV